MQRPEFKEELISQIPALQLLMTMDFQYLTPDEALHLRGGRADNVILESVLNDWLRENNWIDFKGGTYEFSDSNIAQAVDQLKNESYKDGLIYTNMRLYEHLTLGISLRQTIDGDSKSFSLKYIDWQNPAHNFYHVTDEFSVARDRHPNQHRRPDIVVFVNGIPLVVIECKRPDLYKAGGGKAVEEAITQMIRNQEDEEIPKFFTYSQLLMAVSTNDALYATTGTEKKFWSVWKEEADIEEELTALINAPLSDDEKDHLYNHRRNARYVRQYFDGLGERLPTVQDRTLYSLLSPERLLHLMYQFIVFDGGKKKIARYQQYFAIEATINRVANLNHQGARTGGVIWHTTGSGKSLTMVMLAKALALHPNIQNPRVVLVTDRINLDDQIWRTFHACDKHPVRAKSGKHLIELVRGTQADIITTVIDKFETVAQEKVKDENVNVFVLVDEGHRGQFGTIHNKMRQVFTNACYIGFTGTPILKADKATVRKFGDFIHKYTMRQAVEDQAVVPLLYEGRIVDLDVNRDEIDKWFERVTRDLTEDQKEDLKRKMSRQEEISRADQRIQEVAFDLSEHYRQNFQGRGFKAQLATTDKLTAIKYKHYLDDFDIVTSEVVISAPDTREGSEEVDNFGLTAVEEFWGRAMERYRSEEKYNQAVVADFAREDGVEILIVVDKLLVGFDEPRNTVLYVDKPLREHGLLQAIARVNRLFEGKDFGYIVDYRGVLGRLNEAMQTYNALEGFDAEDVAGTITDVAYAIDELPGLHSDLWDVFKTVENKQDLEALQVFLAPEDKRQEFYEALNHFASALKVALSTYQFFENTPEQRIQTYKSDLRFFHNLRTAVRQRYAEAIDYKEYEQRVRKLLDEHIRATDTRTITELVNVFDAEAFDAEVHKLEGAAARADTIANRLKRTITERMDENPVLYQKFSKLIEDTIQAYREGRITDLEYFDAMQEALEAVRTGQEQGMPSKLRQYKHAGAYFGILLERFSAYSGLDPETVADIAINVEGLIEQRKIRDWVKNVDVQNTMRGEIDDYLYSLDGSHGVRLGTNDMDAIIHQVVEVARNRDHL